MTPVTSASPQAPPHRTYFDRSGEQRDARRTQELLKEDGRNTGSETYHCDASARLICSAFSLPLQTIRKPKFGFSLEKKKLMNKLN